MGSDSANTLNRAPLHTAPSAPFHEFAQRQGVAAAPYTTGRGG